MVKAPKSLIGARGLDSRSSPFTIDPLRSTVAENYLVRSNSRKTRMQYDRYLHDHYYSNAARLYSRNKNYILCEDPINTRYEGFTNNGTIEFRIRLHGVDGPTLLSSIPVVRREIYSSGIGTPTVGHFEITLEATTSPAKEEYFIRFDLNNATFGTLTQTTATLKLGYDKWYHVAIRYNNSTGDLDFFLDGVKEHYASTAGRAGGYGSFVTDTTNSLNGNILIGANEALTTFADFDIDEFRLWQSLRSDADIRAYDDRELPSSEVDSNLQCYLNFEETSTDEVRCTDKQNSAATVLLGGYTPFDTGDGELLFDGFGSFGELTGTAQEVFGSNARSSEIACTFLKAKQGYIAGDLELFADSGNSKWGVRFNYNDGGTPSTVATAGFIDSADFGVTKYYISVRIDTVSVPTNIKIYVDGVQQATTNLAGVWTPIAGSTGQNIATNVALTGEFVSLIMEWVRGYTWIREETYHTTYYNTEPPQSLIDTMKHGLVDGIKKVASATAMTVTGIGTNWTTGITSMLLSPAASHDDPETGDPGLEYDAWPVTISGATAAEWAKPTGPWTADSDLILNNQEYGMSLLTCRFNAGSIKSIYRHKTNGKHFIIGTSRVTNGFDRDKLSLSRMLLQRTLGGTVYNRDRYPFRISGETKNITTFQKVRFISQFINDDANIDVFVAVIGAGLYVIDRATKAVTRYPLNVWTNDYKLFSSAYLDGQLYFTDGKNKFHVYVYNKELRVRYWGMEAPLIKPTGNTFTSTGTNSWTDKIQYAYAYYNKEIDQYSNLCFFDANGNGTELSGTRAADRLDDIEDALDPVYGPTDIVILRSTEVFSTVPNTYWVIVDYIGSRSTGCMRWEQDDVMTGFTRWPLNFLNVGDISPPKFNHIVSHRERIWGLKEKRVHYSRVDSQLHASAVSETYMYPADHFLEIEDEYNLTAAISVDGLLFLATAESWHVLSGFDRSDFELRKVYDGRGCPAPLTLKRFGLSFVWMGQDDIYEFRNGKPEPLDPEGKISDYIKDHVGTDKYKECFAVVNKEDEIYELHIVNSSGIRRVIYYDLKIGEFTIGTDLDSSYGISVVEDRKTTTYHGSEFGFIFKRGTAQNYQPTSGSKSGTLTLFTVIDPTKPVITVAESDLQITEGGLIGNYLYILDGGTGSIFRARILANTNNTITVDGSGATYPFGNTFLPTSLDTYYIGSILWKMNSSVLFSRSQFSADRAREFSPDLASAEIIEVEFIHAAQTNLGDRKFTLAREGEDTDIINDLRNIDKYSSIIQFPHSSRYRFVEFTLVHMDETDEFDLVGFSLNDSLTRDAMV
jgi:hypothetical protein